MIRLIYYKNIRKNFANLYKADIEASAAILKKVGLSDPDVQKLKRIESLSRKEMIELVQKIEELGRGDILKLDKEQGIHTLTAQKIGGSLRGFLLNLDECIPLHWVETSSSQRSECEQDYSLGAKAEKAMREIYNVKVINRKYENISRKTDLYKREMDEVYTKAANQDPVVSSAAMDVKIVEARTQAFRLEAQRLGIELDLVFVEERMARAEERLRELGDGSGTRERQNIEADLVRDRRRRAELQARISTVPVLGEDFMNQTSSKAGLEVLKNDPDRYFKVVSEALTLRARDEEQQRQDIARSEEDIREYRRQMELGRISEEVRASYTKAHEDNIKNLQKQLEHSAKMREFVEVSRRALASGNQDQAALERLQEIISERSKLAFKETLKPLEQTIEFGTKEIERIKAELAALETDSPRRGELQTEMERMENFRGRVQGHLDQALRANADGYFR